MEIKIDSLILDESIFSRSMVDSVHVNRLLEAIKRGVKLPPIVIDSKTNTVVDGWHRVEAHKKAKLEKIAVEKKHYEDPGAILADSYRLNTSHGLILQSYDIKLVVEKLLRMGWERDRISGELDIAKYRLDNIINRGLAVDAKTGKPVALKKGLSHYAQKTVGEKKQRAIKGYAGMHGTFYANQLNLLIDSDMWPRTEEFERAMVALVSTWEKAKPDVD